jgi:hypothetical protein
VSYQVHMVTKEGRPAVLKSISTPERAMEAVAAVLRNGTIINAWVSDDEGKKHADLAAIKKHCGIR